MEGKIFLLFIFEFLKSQNYLQLVIEVTPIEIELQL